jgi:hypothetical protein
MRYGNWFKEIEAFQENKLPAFFLIASNSLLDMFPDSLDVLYHNTLHLTSKRDMRATMLDLARTHANLPYENLGDGMISLVREKAAKSRTCD